MRHQFNGSNAGARVGVAMRRRNGNHIRPRAQYAVVRDAGNDMPRHVSTSEIKMTMTLVPIVLAIIILDIMGNATGLRNRRMGDGICCAPRLETMRQVP